MLEQVARTIERHGMFSHGERLAVAVSGGADSVCLLHVLLALAPRWGLALSVLHLDHGLRGEESDADALFVRGLADRLGLPLAMRRVEVASDPDNLEQAARRARLEFFRDQVAVGQVDRIALGHTKSDQAETVLFRLLRGSGSAGLAGVRPVSADGRIVRPLIEVERAEILMYLGERGIGWREDSSNRDPGFARNRIRHQLLPQLAREWNPSIVDTLARTADWAREEEQYWAGEIDRLSGDVLRQASDAVLIDCRRLSAQPPAVRRRLVRRAMEIVRGDLREVEFGHVEAILSLAGGRDGHGRVQAPGIDALRSFDWLRIGRPGAYREASGGYCVELPVPGSVAIPGTSTRIVAELIDNSETKPQEECVYNSVMGGLDWHRVSVPLKLRNWRPGDAYQPAGHDAARKLKDLFQFSRIPLWERRPWPVVEEQGGIVWAGRFGPAVRCAAGSGTRVVLRIREERADDGIGTGAGSVYRSTGHGPGGREVS